MKDLKVVNIELEFPESRYADSPFELVTVSTDADVPVEESEYYEESVDDNLPLIDAICRVQTMEMTKQMFLDTAPNDPKGSPKGEVVYRGEEEKYGVRHMHQLRGPIHIIEALLNLTEDEVIEFKCLNWDTHKVMREGLEQLVYWTNGFENYEVQFVYVRDEWSRAKLYVEEEDQFCTEESYKYSYCSIVHPADCFSPPLYLVSGPIEAWYSNCEVPPSCFLYKFEDMTESERKEVEESYTLHGEEVMWAGGEGVWGHWGSFEPEAQQVAIIVSLKEEEEE